MQGNELQFDLVLFASKDCSLLYRYYMTYGQMFIEIFRLQGIRLAYFFLVFQDVLYSGLDIFLL